MSKVSVFIQAVDGRFYQNPVLFGDGWFLCFDDDDPPEIVVASGDKRKALARAKEVAKEKGLSIKLTGEGQKSARCFPPEWRGFIPAYGFLGQLTAEIPIPDKHDAVVDLPSSQCVFTAFTMKFDQQDVAALLDGHPDKDIGTFVTGQSKPDYAKVTRAIKKQLGVKNQLEFATKYPAGSSITLRKI